MDAQTRIIYQKYRNSVVITKHEKKVCRLLKELGIVFKQQYRFDYNNSFIMVDILLPKTKTIIEIDGKHHYKGQKLLDDAKRDMFLKSIGFNVIRIENDEVRTMDGNRLANILSH